MKRINAAKFKKPRLIPASLDCADLIGSMKGKIRVQRDILSTELKWDAESKHAHPGA
jgi:hypothetical protein